MAKILSNKKTENDEYYIITVKTNSGGKPGQFYMVRSWNTDPLLSRAFSIYERDEETVSFLYKVIGKGTKFLTQLKEGEELTLYGPYGHGFPKLKDKRIAMIGGGVGIAPLVLAAREAKKNNTVDIHFSLRDHEILRDELEERSDFLNLKVNERVTEDIDYSKYDVIFTCGPEGMMEDLTKEAKENDIEIYCSMERVMGCGFGVCSGCTIIREDKENTLVCKDGPVYLGEEVFSWL